MDMAAVINEYFIWC